VFSGFCRKVTVSLTDELPLSRSRIDRDAVSRKIPGFLEQLWENPETAVIVIWRGEALLQPGSDSQLAIFAPQISPSFATGSTSGG